MMDEIKKELLELEFNADSIGLVYWIEAIKYIRNNPLSWDVMAIYEHIASEFNTTKTRAERNLRNAITPAKKNIQEKYKYYRPIRNQTFLNLIRYELI